ncbi:DUF4349 domain-containing protein [Microbacterium sp. NIBRBAC000506063]|uniref:DUF4349 domain-containing protein n=1 Tax=Microbacterium sp. NIBRBAC000506063 TaxID=2734618 RepID=UPI001BB6EFF8|nr:DUF4349 domain-containing protein [Microbacterium sp. NIBRBAC000506063]QTV79639.1 DUF4349 domain-containing protein [Microbacterium sp. NIBRBAC000506063]
MNDTRIPDLPALSEESIDRIEQALFAQVADEPRTADAAASARPARSRRRTWLTIGGVAAAFVVGVLVTPPILGIVTPSAMNESAVSPASDWSIEMADSAAGMAESLPEHRQEMLSLADGDVASLDSSDPTAGRDIIANGYASVHVDGVAVASEEVAALARTHGGYVESTNIGEVVRAVDPSLPAPPPGGDYGWVTIRVPADALTEVMSQLQEVGEVRSSSVSRYDVTSQAIDLRARVEATRASVERLTDLMGQTGSVSELIEAEMALSDRQAQLESYEQQLAALDDQVAMSSLDIELVRITPVTQADPAGFADGLKAGWNGLIVSLNALVIAAGFVLPWLAVAGVVVLVIWFIRRSRRQRRTAASAAASVEPDVQ